VALIPADYRVSLLDGVTLLVQNIGSGPTEDKCKIYVAKLVAEAFEAFLYHAKSVLLEENARIDPDDEGEALQKEISLALTALMQHVVQDFETGLIILGVDLDVRLDGSAINDHGLAMLVGLEQDLGRH
jgi:hypothetical protein